MEKKEQRWKAAVVTLSDKGYAGEREDKSGPLLCGMLEEAGFEVMDKIVLSFKAEKTICEVFAAHKEEIQSEVLAVDIKEGALEGYQKEWNINGHKVELGVEKQ